ncbi:hypothetical protein LEP1GSC050_1522 [Leptospira broomii serovar Hurstbridge str. 5399]|uniref:Uncharacterized protein n=1 Tax=Leptospira broomii serovar Hurstbridge str. 5399 TaxID=1049789 RepID=T0GDJ0_9LEPT|nr:hypothetical protein LEP1GSC050_1522 [Leptospira broomii serovar Hurstbridge str. 5399]
MLFFDDFKTREFLFFSRKFPFLGHILSFDRFANFPKYFFDLFPEFSDSYPLTIDISFRKTSTSLDSLDAYSFQSEK